MISAVLFCLLLLFFLQNRYVDALTCLIEILRSLIMPALRVRCQEPILSTRVSAGDCSPQASCSLFESDTSSTLGPPREGHIKTALGCFCVNVYHTFRTSRLTLLPPFPAPLIWLTKVLRFQETMINVDMASVREWLLQHTAYTEASRWFPIVPVFLPCCERALPPHKLDDVQPLLNFIRRWFFCCCSPCLLHASPCVVQRVFHSVPIIAGWFSFNEKAENSPIAVRSIITPCSLKQVRTFQSERHSD